MTTHPPTMDTTPQRLPLTALIAALVALATLYITTRNWILAPVAVVLIGAYVTPMRLDGHGNFVRLGRYVFFGLVLWQAYDFATSPAADSTDMALAYTAGYLCAIEMAIQSWLRRPASGARSPATILLSAMVFLAASNTVNQDYIRYFTPLYFLFLSLSWRAYQPSMLSSQTFWNRGWLLAGVLSLSALVHGSVWHYRQEISNWGMRFLEGRALETTGISTDAHLGSSFNLQGSLDRTLRVENIKANTGDGEGTFYLRTAAFADYENNRWFPLINREPGQSITSGQLKAPLASVPLKPRPLHIVRLKDDQNLVFAPLHTAGFSFPPDTLLQWTPPLEPLQATASGSSGTLSYDVLLSQQEKFQGYYCTPPDSQWLARYRKVPDDIDPRVRELARTIGASARTDTDKIRAVETHLLTNHSYSLRSRFGRGDRISDFLLNKRNAHCEFFASGGVVLLRCLGVPCRYVIGYVAHEPDGDDALVVRGRDAHAWIECWIDHKWVTVDFTPGDGRPEGRAGPLPPTIKFKEFVQRLAVILRSWLQELRNLPLRYWLAIFGALIVFLVWRGRSPSGRRISREVFTYASRDAELSRLAGRFEKWLLKRNSPCPPGLTWPEYARRAGIEEALAFAKLYDAARFGRADNLPELQKLLAELERLP